MGFRAPVTSGASRLRPMRPTQLGHLADEFGAAGTQARDRVVDVSTISTRCANQKAASATTTSAVLMTTSDPKRPVVAGCLHHQAIDGIEADMDQQSQPEQPGAPGHAQQRVDEGRRRGV
jgi:hypothetical protein